jgi:hypothetical protein
MAFLPAAGQPRSRLRQRGPDERRHQLVRTLAISIVVAYLMVYVLQKIESGVRLFLSIAVLLLIYAIQKLFHLSPLILI